MTAHVRPPSLELSACHVWNRAYATPAVDALVTNACQASEVRRIRAHTRSSARERSRAREAGFAVAREMDEADQARTA